MKYLLDTNICIHFLRGKFNLLEKFQEVKIEDCAISEITLAELVLEQKTVPTQRRTLIL